MFALRKCAFSVIGVFLIALSTIVLPVPNAAAQGTLSSQKQPGYQKSLPHPSGCVRVPDGCQCVIREGTCCMRAGNCYRR
jgi:hypothetical protein